MLPTMLLAALLSQAPAEAAPPLTVAVPGLRLEAADAQARDALDGHVVVALERAGYRVQDGAALRQAGYPLPENGCVSAKPLCGAAPGVDLVLLGLIRETPGGYVGQLEMRASPEGTLLWKQTVSAESAAALGQVLEQQVGAGAPVAVAKMHSNAGFKPQTWGWVTLTAGTLSAIGGGTLLASAGRKMEVLRLNADGSNRLFTKDAIRYAAEGPRDVVLGGSLIGVGVAGIVTGIYLATRPDAPAGVPTVTVGPDLSRPGLVFSGSLP